MKKENIFLAATGRSLTRAEQDNGGWQITHQLEGVKINTIVRGAHNSQKVYLGTQHHGLMVSSDLGISWKSLGMEDKPIKAIALDPNNPQKIFVGSKPVSLFMSENEGGSWVELETMRQTRKWWWFSPADPPGWTPYVNALAVSPTDPDVILAGIELGAVMRSEDGGWSWSKHLRGSDRDCHSLKFHPVDGNWVYEGGGISGPALSQDGGKTWRKPKEGLGKKYGWMVAADPERPEVWYVSASKQPNLLRGEFNPPAHKDGQANGHIYRKIGDEPWQQLGGGLPEPMDYFAYDLATLPEHPGTLFAGLANGEVWLSEDYGDHWSCLPFNVGRVHSSMIVI